MNDKPRGRRPLFGEGPPKFWPWFKAGFAWGIGFFVAGVLVCGLAYLIVRYGF